MGQAQASATSSSASVLATGSSASTIAKATGTGLYSFVQGTALAPADRVGAATSQGIVAGTNPAPTFATAANFQSAAYITAAPLSSDVTAAWASDANVKSAFNNTASNVNALLLANMQYAASGTGASHDYRSALELNENNAPLTGNGLVVGLLTPQLTGSGLQPGDSLRFRIQRQGITLVDQIFSTNPALSYFQNSVYDLGIQNSGLNGANLDVQFLFDLTTTHSGPGIGAQLIVGNDSNAQIGIWNNAAGGSWASPTNWSASTLPDGPGVQATFGSVISMPQTVTLDESTTVGNLQFNNQTSYTIAQGAGGGSLILDNAGAAAIINVSAGNHSISAPISIGAAGVNVSVANGDLLTASGSISGTGGITKGAAGTLLLSGVNSYGGATSVNGGTLVVNGSISGAVTVNSTGTLQGTGSVGGLVTINSGGILAPGNSPGMITLGSLLLNNGAQTNIELGGTTHGSQYDAILASGNVNLGGTLHVSLINGFAPLAGNSFDILDWGSLSGRFSALQLPILNNGPLGWDTSQLYSTGVVSVTATVLGDFNRDGLVTVADISAMMQALTDLKTYQATYSLTNAQLIEIGDLDGSGQVTDADLQALINLLANGGGNGSLTVVPEPGSIVLLGLGVLAIALRRHSR